MAVVIAAAVLTLVLGLSLLYDGFSASVTLQGGPSAKALPSRRLRRLMGGAHLIAYLPLHFPSQGRVVAHWPLDLAITVVSGAVMVVYGILGA